MLGFTLVQPIKANKHNKRAKQHRRANLLHQPLKHGIKRPARQASPKIPNRILA
jgi:hypothetical protein